MNKQQKHINQFIKKAFELQAQGKKLEAAKFYQYLINHGIQDQRIFSNYGVILKNLGKLKEAELSYRKAIDIKPDCVDAHYNLGNLLKNLGRLKEAELSYRKAIDIKSDYAQAHYNLGNLLINFRDFQKAELSYQKAIHIKPDYADAHYNLGNLFRDLGRLKEAELSYRKAIDIKPDYAQAHYNLGVVLKNLGNYQGAELSYLKAIDIKPDYAPAHSNLGNLFRDLGRLKEAELLYLKAIQVNPDYSKAYYSLSLLKCSDKNKIWQDQLFSKSILKNISKKNQIDIYFARANIFHKEKNYVKSCKYLLLANNLKLELNSSRNLTHRLINKSKELLIESKQININKKIKMNSSESIFIVGMPRCGSTLVESILSTKNNVYDLGEVNTLEESFLEYKKSKEDLNLAELYWEKVSNKTNLNITTNKWLYNFQYSGIIAQQIPGAKIIHCYRNPLDNILSIFRAHFAQGNKYSSSLVDCTNVYLNQDTVMREYKKRFQAKIYDLNYDKLVRNPNQEIKSLISWLGWKWDDSFLKPHLNQRSVLTRSNVEIRSPINSNSIDGWKNYKDMLKPAIEILSQSETYSDYYRTE